VPLVLMGVQVANFSGSLLKTQTLSNLGLATQVEAERVERQVSSAEQGLDDLATSTELNQLILQQNDSNSIALSNDELETKVKDELDKLKDSGLIGIAIRVAGGTTHQSGSLQAQTELTANLITVEDDLLIGDVFFVEGLPRMAIIRHVGTSGLGATIITEWSLLELLGEGLDPTSFGDGAEVMVLVPQIDGSQRVVYSSDPGRVNDATSITGNPVVGAPVVIETDGFDGRSVVQSTARVSRPSWLTVIEANPDTLFTKLDTIRLLQVAVFVGAGLVIIAVVAFSLRTFVLRLGRVTALAEAVADGDLTVRTGDDRLDELGRLSMAFDDMAEALAQDIARRERVEAQLAYQATHDSLTGLPNRQQLIAELDRLLVESEDLVSVLFVDLDGFKQVNDRLGHGAGDELLVRVSDRLRGVLRPTDFVARLGGDEFVVVLRGLGLMDAERMAERIVSALELPFIVTDDECSISASIGVSSANDERSSERLIKEADIAMYRARRSVRDEPSG
jgi:diguanylate cyclase (GGDEF)-like protein